MEWSAQFYASLDIGFIFQGSIVVIFVMLIQVLTS